jgi:hypoxanthine phosphoribosyltransferase
MENINVHDLSFVPFIKHQEIVDRVKQLANQINLDYQDKNPIFVPILNGAFIFAADLIKEINIPCEVSFVKVSSYLGTQSSGEVDEVIGLDDDIRGRHLIIVEDIVDTGITMGALTKLLKNFNPESITICSLFTKPDSIENKIDIQYTGFEIEDKFILGYGLDYDQQGRNLKDVYQKV